MANPNLPKKAKNTGGGSKLHDRLTKELGGDPLVVLKDWQKIIKEIQPQTNAVNRMLGRDGQLSNLTQGKTFTFGTPDQKGYIDLLGKASNQMNDILTRSQRHDLRDDVGLAGITRRVQNHLSPEAQQMVQFAQSNAQQAQQAAGGLTGQEARSAQQFAREGAADRGRLNDNSAIASEVLNRDNILGQKRQEANALTNNAFNMASSFYQQPGLQMLNQTPQSYMAGQNALGQGMGMINQGNAQSFDMGVPLNMMAINQGNQNQMAMAKLQADATKKAGMYQAGGSILEGFAKLNPFHW